MDAMTQLLAHNIKPSVQRMAIMNYLMEHRTHPTAEEIFSALSPAMPTLSKTTVYNTLRLLSEAGAVQTLTIDERNTCYDADTTEHAHFFCRQCQRVLDIPIEHCERKEFSIGDNLVQETHYYLKGICANCLKKGDL